MRPPITFDCVTAADAADGIGKNNDLPWPKLTEDLRFLRRITTTAPPGRRNAVIMGRLTWESVPSNRQPLPGRLNVVISRAPQALPADMLAATSLQAALEQSRAQPDIDGLFVIGGAQIFKQAFAHPGCRRIYITRLSARFDCDAFLPPLPAGAVLAEVLSHHRENGIDYEIQRWEV